MTSSYRIRNKNTIEETTKTITYLPFCSASFLFIHVPLPPTKEKEQKKRLKINTTRKNRLPSRAHRLSLMFTVAVQHGQKRIRWEEGDGEGLRAEILISRLEEVAGMIAMALGSIDDELSVGFTLAISLRRSRGVSWFWLEWWVDVGGRGVTRRGLTLTAETGDESGRRGERTVKKVIPTARHGMMGASLASSVAAF